MINNLFSIFDPSSSIFQINWISIFLPALIISPLFYKVGNITYNTINSISNKIRIEVKVLIKTNSKEGRNIWVKTLFSTILLTNIIALIPFIFTPTAHISVSFSSALIMWLSIILFSIKNFYSNTIVHLVPIGTPTPLINFIVLIETTRNVIRPITLSVRLTANIVAGHLLISLLGNFTISSQTNFLSIVSPIIILTGLEIAVALIQAYVFVTLITLYHNEIF